MIRSPETQPHKKTDHQRLLALASIFEDEFSIDSLLELTEEKPSQILRSLEEGVNEACLGKVSPGVFYFVDQEKRLALLDGLGPREKEKLHRHLADVYMKDQKSENTDLQDLARHLLHITNGLEGCHWLLRAGDQKLSDFHTDEALQCYQKVLEDLSGVAGKEANQLFTQAAIKYSRLSMARHDTQKVLVMLQEAMARAKMDNNQGYLGLLEMHLAKNEWLSGRHDRALKHFQKGWSLAKAIDNPRLLRSATAFRIFFYYWQGLIKEVIQSYETSLADVERFPKGRFPLLASMMAGYCYALNGQVTQGLGLMDAIRIYCHERGDKHVALHADMSMSEIMLLIGRGEETISIMEKVIEAADQERIGWIKLSGKQLLAYAYCLNMDHRRAAEYLKESLQQSRKVHVNLVSPILLELCWVLKESKRTQLTDLSFEDILLGCLKSKNLLTRGAAYRYKALNLRQEGHPPEKIMNSLNRSMKYLQQSGHKFEIVRTGLELARTYLWLGKEDKAKEIASAVTEGLQTINEALIPEDVRHLIQDRPTGENLLQEILKLGQEAVTIRDHGELVQHIISTVNRLAGAERGAIFLLADDKSRTRLELHASKNLTSEDVADPGFASSIKMINEVAVSGRGRIEGEKSAKGKGRVGGQTILSRICVPMILRDKVAGVLYHDNRLMSSAFKESDMELLAYFASQAAFALDNASAYEKIRRQHQKLNQEKLYYEEQHLKSLHFEDIVGESSAIRRLLSQVDQVAGTDATVLILGETGVGKELVASAIHRHSHRRNKAFIRVHCSALPESLITSELFGHEKGAFTGATGRRLGRFELADRGTLFLDEVGDLPLEVQVRLLRVLQTKEFERVGGVDTIRSDFRLIAATNRDLKEAVRDGSFREDLYYRLNVFPIHVPPLRERIEDVPLVAHYFLTIYAAKMSKNFDGIPKKEIDKLMRYNWPGNVRELENIIERGVILSPGPIFAAPELSSAETEQKPKKPNATLMDNERRHILWALEQTGWKVRGPGGAAELLEIHYSTLRFRMKKLGIKRPQKHEAVSGRTRVD